MPVLISMTTRIADSQGKISFRLKDERLGIFDPYYYVTED
jgi:hypothetical protein